MSRYVKYNGLQAHVEICDILRKLRDDVILPLKKECETVRTALIAEREKARRKAAEETNDA